MHSNTAPTNNNTWGQTLMDPVDEDGSDLYRVAYPYQAVLEDELSLKFNQVIYLITSFDDGWGLGRNVLTGVQGAFPMACVTKLADESESNHGTIVVGEDVNQIGAQNINFKTIQRRTSSQKINLKYSKSTTANTRPMENIGFA
ncbi:hypothetical protein CONCODRAFT_69221 [Conidiobolus coronatus NRRL 28638]|uniref:SH3 domain-containing protein n=1 Tax=Conidiobolus coronatus (strain ATCC 28846 / CBS 209.66 / NRRL 28638) TaxID=796925 RepID=A0A137PB14_CONC2|nr:hypothetical protein CONCODRAFT_69221 [Conidiobolus coronatus NRRL 28638]|eukprot:KXN72175.1 hypothetical protein CONCODRAFT_69221 [Conidiobolus coronatus NRRL 28638]